MLNYLKETSPILCALYASLFTWGVTALGAAVVFFFKNISKNILDSMLGFAGGIMIAASFFSLLMPAITMAEILNFNVSLVVSLGFFTGAILLFITDNIINLKIKHEKNHVVKRSLLLILSITMHNIPEGMIIGVAFGSIANNIEGVSLISAVILAIGIGIQNFPEGCAVSVPLRREGYSRLKAFFIGQLSGIVEPISAVLGVLLVMKIRYLLPFFLSFAAGAMIFVVIIDLIPESQKNKLKGLVTISTMLGFIIMMVLDISLG